MTASAPPVRRGRREWRDVLFALLGAGMIVLMLVIVVLAVPYLDGSEDFSAASGDGPTADLTPSPWSTETAPTSSTSSTQQQEPELVVFVEATATTRPFKAPPPPPTPFPTCPSDREGVTCFKPANTPTPRPISTLAPVPPCDEAPPETWCKTRLTPTPEANAAATPSPRKAGTS